jgi:hypothetical protein
VDLSQQQSAARDLIVEDHAFANGAYRLGPTVRLRAGVDGSKANHSDAARAAFGSRATSVIGGVDYVTPVGNAIGLEARRTDGTFPTPEVINGSTLGTPLVNNAYIEKELAVVATVPAGAQLTGTGRIGHTTRKHREFPQRDFSGTTWRMGLDWTPLQKTGFEFALYREPRSIIDIGASYVIVSGVTLGPRWAPTEKLVFSALFIRERQQFAGDPGFIVLGGPQRDETVRTIRLGAGWEPKRFIETSAGWEHGVRSSNGLLRDYDFNALMANVRFRF